MKSYIAGVTLALFAFASSAAAGERRVVVNGVRLSGDRLAQLDRWHCGSVPDGSYWLDLETGIWGYAGHAAPQGHVADGCSASAGSGSSGGSHSWMGNTGYGGSDGNGFGYVCTSAGCVSYDE